MNPNHLKLVKDESMQKKQKNLQNCDFSDDDLMNKQILKNILTKLQNLEQKVIPMPSQNLTETTIPKSIHEIDSTTITTEVPGFIRKAKKSDLNVTIPEEGTLDDFVISFSNNNLFCKTIFSL